MSFSNQAGVVGFLVALSTLSVSTVAVASAPISDVETTPSIEARLNRLTGTIRQLETQLPEGATLPEDVLMAIGFVNGPARGGWTQVGGGGWVNGPLGGSFINANPWRNAWGNGGGFWNRF